MSLIQKTDKFMQYKYRVDEFIIIAGKENIKLEPMQIVDMTISCDYENDIFPLFKVMITTEPETYVAIVKNKDNVKFKVRIQKYSINQSNGAKSLYTDYINDVFSVFLDDTDSQFDETLHNKARETDKYKKGEVALNMLNQKIELYLFKESYVNNIKKRINMIPKSITMTTALAYITSVSKLNGLLLSPLDNKKTYSPLKLPSLNAFKLIQYLDYNYGFYKNGSMIFFGLDKPYILNYKKGCTAWSKGEWKETIFIVLEGTNEHSKMPASIIRGNEKKYYINTQRRDVIATNSSVTNNAIGGTDAYVIDADGDKVSTVSANAKTRGNANTTRIVNDTQNPYLGTTFAAQQAASSIVISVGVGNANLDAFTPNKDVTFIFEDNVANKEYKGHYRLVSSYFKFIKNGEDFSVDVNNVYKIAQ